MSAFMKERIQLKGQCHEIFCFWFFYGTVSPQPQRIPLGPFRIFSKIRGDIRKSTTPAAKIPPISTTPAANFATSFASVVDIEMLLMAVMVYSGTWEKLIHEKNQKSKISWHCPFKE
jgi:hypothetical protein